MSSEVDKLKAEIKKLKAENLALNEDAAFKPIFDQAPLGIFRTIMDGGFLKVNQTLCDILGYENQEDLFDHVENLEKDVYWNPSDRKKIVKELLKAPHYAKFEIDFKKKDRSVITCNITAKAIRDGDGKLKYIEGIAEDITEIKRVEQERKKSETLYKALVDTLSDTIVISDLSGVIEFVSPSVKRISGLESTEGMVGTNILNWLKKDSQNKAKENFQRIINGHPQNFEEYEMVRKDGTTFYTEIRTSILRDENNNPSKLISLIQDITHRKKTDEILRETQELYRTIIELSPAGIVITHKNEIFFLNSAMGRILDVEDIWDLIGTKFKPIVSTSYRKEVAALLNSAEKTDQHGELSQIQIISSNGSLKEVDIVVSPIFYDGKKCSFIFINDVTKRVNAEKALKIDKQLMEAFWDTLPDSITFKNHKGQYFKVNEQFVKWAKLKRKEDILGATDEDIFGKEHFKRSQREEKNIIKKGEVIINDLREEVWPDKSKKWVMLTKMPLFDINHNVVGVFSFTRDITQQKKSEIAITEREQWFRYIFDQSPVAKVITDRKFTIKRTNNSLRELLHLSKDEMIGESVYKIFDKKEKDQIKDWLKSINYLINHVIQNESVVVTRKQENRMVLVQAVHLKDLSGDYGEYLIHFIDIHDRKLTEEELRVRNSELNNFVYKVSHDLRAPLTSVKGLINLVQLENDPAVYNQYIQMINGRIERLDDFIRDVLSHSKNLNVEVKIEEINLRNLIDDCVNYMAFHPNYNRVKLDVNVKGKELFSDYQRLHEILRNLISNAFQYSRKRDNAFIKIDARVGKSSCKICIEDNGLGIRKKYQPNIFDMFYRANENVEGSGLGLYIVKLSVEKLKGKIDFNSKVNSGTWFEIEIPNHVK